MHVVVECDVEPWVLEGMDDVFISRAGRGNHRWPADQRISRFGFRWSSILDPRRVGVKRRRREPDCEIAPKVSGFTNNSVY